MRMLTRHKERSVVSFMPTIIGLSFFMVMMAFTQPPDTSHAKGRGSSQQAVTPASQQAKNPPGEDFSPLKSNGHGLLAGDRIIIGTVTEITAGLIKVEQEDSLQPRFLPLYRAHEKDMPIREGDKIKLILNEQQLLVDFFPLGPIEGNLKVIKGVIAQEMPVGQERVVVKTEKGETVSFFVRPLARSKVASIPVGVDVVFLTDETGKIVDATFGSEEAVDQASQEYKRMSNLKAPHKRVEGMVIDPLEKNTITIETEGGKKWTYPVRPLLKDKIAPIEKGERLTVLIDSDNHVIDIAQFPR